MKANENMMEPQERRIRVQITAIQGDIAKCKHIMSAFTVKAYIRKDMKLEEGQVVILEYRRNQNGGGYIIADELIDEIEVNVLDAQHIISDGVMYISLIFENPITHKRMHSLVPSSNKLFGSTNIIIKGDKIKLKINNGNVFSIDTEFDKTE